MSMNAAALPMLVPMASHSQISGNGLLQIRKRAFVKGIIVKYGRKSG